MSRRRKKKEYSGVIFKATFPDNKSFIGRSTVPMDCKKMLMRVKMVNSPFKEAVDTHGFDSIVWEELASMTAETAHDLPEMLDDAVQYYINKCNTMVPYGYNAKKKKSSTNKTEDR